MSVAFWNERKKRKLNPRIEIEIKDDKSFLLHPKKINVSTRNTLAQYKKNKSYIVDDLKKLDVLDAEICLPPKRLLKLMTAKNVEATLNESKLNNISFYKMLFPYQKEGVQHVISKFNGRGLIGDEMGLGKTLQGLCIYSYYQPKNLLIICPAYLRYTWKHEINKWAYKDCHVINKGKDIITDEITIISYELAAKKVDELYKFDMVICDESHYLKNHKTKRTKALTPLLKRKKHVLLLTGTPALNRPCELYPQCHILRPDLFKTFKEYTKRYCDGKMHPAGYYDYSGSSNKNELNWLCKKTIMIRRLKRDVLTDLPLKQRSEIYLQMSKKETKPLKPLFERWFQLNDMIKSMEPCSEEIQKASFERKVLITELYRKSSMVKHKAVKKVVKDMVQQGLKFIVFCYHKSFMDEMEEACDGVEYIRIDGDTPVEKRQNYVDEFQSENSNIKVAILSLLAASTGFTLTATSLMVFAELYFVPGTMLQAEDRIHRIGQKNNVDIRYIIAEGTLDDYIFKMLTRKIDTLDKVLDCRNDRNFLIK